MTVPTIDLGRYQGDLRRCANAGGYLLSESAYEPGARFERHRHEGAFAYLILSGECVETYGAAERAHKKHSFLFHSPYCEHSTEWLSAGRCLHVTLTPARWRAWEATRACLQDVAFAPSSLASILALRALGEFRSPDSLSALAIEGLMSEILVEVGRADRKPADEQVRQTLERFQTIVSRNVGRDWRLADVAKRLGISPATAAALFRDAAGVSFTEFLRQARIEFACQELERGATPLAEIAVEAGFYDQSHFARTFKRVKGMTVTEYRRACADPV